jgi:hypothetical protein
MILKKCVNGTEEVAYRFSKLSYSKLILSRVYTEEENKISQHNPNQTP